MTLLNSFLIAFSAILPVINPVGSALLMLGLVGPAPNSVYRSLARRVAINNVIFLLVIELLGATILSFFGVSLPIVQFAGGMVIAVMGWKVLNEPDAATSSRSKREETGEYSSEPADHVELNAFYPFTFPITSGPGTLVVLLTVTAHSSNRNLEKNTLAHLGVFLAIVVLSVLIYFCYAYAPKISKVISASTSHGILRVIAFILLCIGVQIAWNGLAVLLGQVMRP